MQRVDKYYNQILKDSDCDTVNGSDSGFCSEEDEQQTVSTKVASYDKYSKEKSLGVLACKFIRLLQSQKYIAIERAAEILSQNIANKYKTKVPALMTQIRRLYDVSKVLITIGLIKQTYDNKRSTLEWLGVEFMVSKLNHMIKSSFARLIFGLDGKPSNICVATKKNLPIPGPTEYLGKRICIDPLEAEAFIAKCRMNNHLRFDSVMLDRVT